MSADHTVGSPAINFTRIDREVLAMLPRDKWFSYELLTTDVLRFRHRLERLQGLKLLRVSVVSYWQGKDYPKGFTIYKVVA